jgi:hypothetical protein
VLLLSWLLPFRYNVHCLRAFWTVCDFELNFGILLESLIPIHNDLGKADGAIWVASVFWGAADIDVVVAAAGAVRLAMVFFGEASGATGATGAGVAGLGAVGVGILVFSVLVAPMGGWFIML